MFIIKSQNSVAYGPAQYDPRMFKWILVNDLELDISSFTLPSQLQSDSVININEDVAILPVEIQQPQLDSDIEQPAGPNWIFSHDKAIASYTAEPKPIDAIKNELKAIIAKQRFEKEVGGLDIGGSKILTDRESQSQLNGAYVALKNNLVTTINWKSGNGTWADLTINEIEPLAIAVSTHVQSCFTEEKTKCEAVDAATTLSELKTIAESLKPQQNLGV